MAARAQQASTSMQFEVRSSSKTGMGYVVPHDWARVSHNHHHHHPHHHRRRSKDHHGLDAKHHDGATKGRPGYASGQDEYSFENECSDDNFTFSSVVDDSRYFSFSCNNLQELAEQYTMNEQAVQHASAGAPVFSGGGPLSPSMSSADELFHNGKIRPLLMQHQQQVPAPESISIISAQSLPMDPHSFQAISVYEEPPQIETLEVLGHEIIDDYGYYENWGRNYLQSDYFAVSTPSSPPHITEAHAHSSPPAPIRHHNGGVIDTGDHQIMDGSGQVENHISNDDHVVAYRRSRSLFESGRLINDDDEGYGTGELLVPMSAPQLSTSPSACKYSINGDVTEDGKQKRSVRTSLGDLFKQDFVLKTQARSMLRKKKEQLLSMLRKLGSRKRRQSARVLNIRDDMSLNEDMGIEDDHRRSCEIYCDSNTSYASAADDQNIVGSMKECGEGVSQEYNIDTAVSLQRGDGAKRKPLWNSPVSSTYNSATSSSSSSASSAASSPATAPIRMDARSEDRERGQVITVIGKREYVRAGKGMKRQSVPCPLKIPPCAAPAPSHPSRSPKRPSPEPSALEHRHHRRAPVINKDEKRKKVVQHLQQGRDRLTSNALQSYIDHNLHHHHHVSKHKKNIMQAGGHNIYMTKTSSPPPTNPNHVLMRKKGTSPPPPTNPNHMLMRKSRASPSHEYYMAHHPHRHHHQHVQQVPSSPYDRYFGSRRAPLREGASVRPYYHHVGIFDCLMGRPRC